MIELKQKKKTNHLYKYIIYNVVEYSYILLSDGIFNKGLPCGKKNIYFKKENEEHSLKKSILS